MSTIPVLAAPLFDPGSGRVDLELPAGMTVGQIVTAALPGATQRDLAHARVMLVSATGSAVVTSNHWDRVRPRTGVRVVIRIVPGKDALRSILMIVVSIAAIALGQYWAIPLASTLGISTGLAAGIIGLGVNVLGALLVNALIPPTQSKSGDKNQSYQISGWRNRLDPNGVVPDVMGKLRYAPPFGAMSWTEIVGDVQYIRSLFNFGYGPLSLSDFRIGDTDTTEYDEITMEIRTGYADDEPLSLYPTQIVEENVGAELARPKPRDDQGEVDEGGAGVETPIVRTTGPDAKSASIIIGFPGGLIRLTDSGDKRKVSVEIRIRQRQAGTETWNEVETLNVNASKTEAFYRQYSWDFAVRGRYEIEVTRMTDEHTSTQMQSRSSWVALQTLRSEYPLNFDKPLALVALRVKATYQINGALDNFNALTSRICLDWDSATSTWIMRETSNPASLFRLALQSAANPRPVADDGIYLDELADWHEFCTAKGLKYDRVLEDDKTLRDVLSEIASAGRAAQRHDGLKWGVIIDRPQELVVDHINPRNSWQFQSSRSYFTPPHAFRVSFQDATNDYKPAERLVPWPGFSGSITLTEALELPGKTDPEEIWREARRRMYEALYRPDTYSVIQDGPARVATRGDLVVGSFVVLERTQLAARVKSITGDLVELDEIIHMEADRSYAIRFRRFLDPDDTVGTSLVRPVMTSAGEHKTLVMTGDGCGPISGEVIHFGPSLTEGFPLRVTRVEAGEEFSSVYRLVDASPIIDELTDEEVAPAWTGRVGADIGDATGAPPAPRFVAIKTGFAGTDSATGLTVLLTPGTGPIVTAQYQLQHRLVGAPTWGTTVFPAADGGADISGYSADDPVQLRAAGISPAGILGDYTTVVTVTIGASDAAIPAAFDDETISVAAVLGGAVVMMSTGPDLATMQVQIYRSTTMSLNRATDAVGMPYATIPSRGYSIPTGDVTRENLIANGGFSSGSDWTLGAGWSVGAGVASFAPGIGSSIAQARTLIEGNFYRVGFTLSAVITGDLTPRLSGGSNRDGTARAADGIFRDRIQAASGNTTFELVASGPFEGDVDDVVAYLETPTCLPQGVNYFWLEPQNSDGVPGPVSGPFAVTIR